MNALARLAVARPRTTLAIWVAAVAAFALLGTGVESRLTQSIFVLPGTETERAIELGRETFGESVFVPVLLEGPPAQLDRQGPELVAAIAAEEGWRALSPWDRGPEADALRPRPGAALVVASVSGPYEQIFDQTAERIRAVVSAEVDAPVSARITGMPVIGNSIKEHTYSSAREAERIALPILLVVLLAVFRAPIAALIPALTGLATVLASSGVLWLVAGSVAIDPIAISLASMMGLALGVDYSLLIVSRFREHAGAGEAPAAATGGAMATAGRTVTFAGGAVLVAMAVGMLVSPGDILVSAAAGVATATVLGVVSAFTAIPAALALFGGELERWRIGPHRDGPPRWIGAVRAALVRPGLAAAAILIPLLVLATPAFGLDTGPPDVSQLPADDPARQDFERISEVMGPGWAAPFEVAIVSREGPITSAERLRTLARWQRRLARSDRVAGVVGPGQLAGDAERAKRAGRSLTAGAIGLDRLAAGIRRASSGVTGLARAQGEAAAAVAALGEGGEDAASGAADIEARLDAVAGGTVLIADAVRRLTGGGERMLDALQSSRAGTLRLRRKLTLARDQLRFTAASAARLLGTGLQLQADEVSELRPRARAAEAHLRETLAALDAVADQSDPNLQAARAAASAAYADVAGGPSPGETETGLDIPPTPSLDAELGFVRKRMLPSSRDAFRIADGQKRLARGLDEAQRAVRRLRHGLRRLSEGAGELGAGAGRIEDALGRLHGGVTAIREGSGQLGAGLNRLADGAAEVSSGFRAGNERVGALILGLDRADEGAGELRRGTSRLTAQAPAGLGGIFDSGYFVLAGVETALERGRSAAGIAVNVRSGGEAGRVVVIPATGPNADETRDLQATLDRRSDRLGDRLDAETAVGGTAGALAEYDARASDRLLWLVLALAAVSFVVLAVIFQSLVLAGLAVVLNLVSVAASFGALALLFSGPDPILGGPGYLDAVSVSAIYTVIFGLSLDYQVFLIARMREGWLRLGDTPAAIAYGLERTGAVITGAAAIMVAVFTAFALTDVAGTRQFGTGMVVAVIIDATLVRLLLLPAAMRLAGDACWGRLRRLRRLPAR